MIYTNMNSIIQNIANKYKQTDEAFAQLAHREINDFLQGLPNKDLKDPSRLSTKAVMLSKLKQSIINSLPSITIGNEEFDRMTRKEQHMMKIKSTKMKGFGFLDNIEILPDNLDDIKLTTKEAQQLAQHKTKVNKEKLDEEPMVFKGDELLKTVMPLLNGSSLIKEVVPALLLATGRRTVEILKTAKFTLTDTMTRDGYRCIFEGQAKSGLEDTGSYEIPLLAPFFMVEEALRTVRDTYDATNVENEVVHQQFASPLNLSVKRLTGTTPHALRAIYAMMCWNLNKKQSSMIGYVSKILGHSQVHNAMYYQRVVIDDLTGPYVPTEEEKAPKRQVEWVIKNKAEAKRVEAIQEMISQRKRLTATSIRNHGGGTLTVIQRIIENNRELIDEYNKSL